MYESGFLSFVKIGKIYARYCYSGVPLMVSTASVKLGFTSSVRPSAPKARVRSSELTQST